MKRLSFRHKIRLDTLSDVNEFVKIASQLEGRIILTDGNHFTVNARSTLGALYSLEWDNLYVESEFCIYTAIEKFVI
jgi:chaperone required for assembly of F1-ATPase